LVPASIAIGAVMEAAFRLGEPIQQVPPEIVPQIIYLASTNSAPQKQKFTESFAFFLISFLVGGCLGVYFLIFIG
jgi:hypothetical protein